MAIAWRWVAAAATLSLAAMPAQSWTLTPRRARLPRRMEARRWRLAATPGPGAGEEGGELSRPSSYQEALARAFGNASADSSLAENPYFDVVMQVAPNEMIGRFMRTSSPAVQQSVKTTILGLLGTMPQFAVDTAVVTTGEKLAQVMFQLQMTGYMFKNAEYRISLSRSLEAMGNLPEGLGDDEAESGRELAAAVGKGTAVDDGAAAVLPKMEGVVSVTLADGSKVEVDAKAYMSELRKEVEDLRDTLAKQESDKKAALQSDLLAYIKTMPEKEIKDLTANMSPEVLEAMQKLVNVVVQSMGAGAEVQPQTKVQQSGAAMGQLCMWQLVIGYNLREMEVKEELRRRFTGGLAPDGTSTKGLPQPGEQMTFDFPLEETREKVENGFEDEPPKPLEDEEGRDGLRNV